MTVPIKLTEEDIHIVLTVGGYTVKFRSLEGFDIIWNEKQAKELKQQILENQKKTEKYNDFVNRCQHSDDEYCIWYHELHIAEQKIKSLEKKLTNKDVKHLHKKDLNHLKDYRKKFLENKKIIEKIKHHLILCENSADPVKVILKKILGEGT